MRGVPLFFIGAGSFIGFVAVFVGLYRLLMTWDRCL